VLPFALLGIVHLDQAQEWWRNGLWRLATLEIVLCVFSATFLPALLLLPLSPIPQNDRLMGGLSILLRHMLVATANGFATVVVLRSLGRMILRMPAGREWHRRTLQVGTVATLVGPFLIVLLLLYASISFPLISRGFGGGKKAVVEVVLA